MGPVSSFGSLANPYPGRIGGELVYIILEGGSYAVLSGLCTHQACDLAWDTVARLYTCDCHGSAFTYNGAVMLEPATFPLYRYRVRVADGHLYVKVN
jgi:cytochrome b6-f complex iron-sulfur subunit